MEQEKKQFISANIIPKNYDCVAPSNSYITSRHCLTLLEKRVVYNIMKVARDFRYKNEEHIHGKRIITNNKDFIQNMILTANDILSPEEQKNYNNNRKYDVLRTTIASLMGKTITATVKNYNGDPINIYTSIVSGMATYQKYDGQVEFNIAPLFLQILMDYNFGYTQLELDTLLGLKSIHSMRFYELLCEWHKTETILCMPIEKLRDFMQCNEYKVGGKIISKKKYPNFFDFKKFVIDTAKKELDKKSPLTFTYEEKKIGRRITHINIRIVNNPSHKSSFDKELPFTFFD